MPEPQTPVHWIDTAGNQQGPEPWETVTARVQAAQIPPTTQVWWDGAPGWQAYEQAAGATSAGADTGAVVAPAAAAAPAPRTASEALMSGLTDQELDDEFIGLVGRSWEMYKETEHATSIDEAMLGGIITALVDCGFVLIDLETAGGLLGAAATGTGTGTGTATTTTTTTTTTTVDSAATAAHHQLRFEEPQTRARVTVAMEHLTPDVASAKMIGHRASAIIGYGERVNDFARVGQAVRQEMQSSFVLSPEPGTVTFDADMSSGYVYAQIDLLLELDRYVDEDLTADHELLRRHLASVVYTMKMFVQSRFGS